MAANEAKVVLAKKLARQQESGNRRYLQDAAKCVAVVARQRDFPSDLGEVIDAWPMLTDEDRKAVVEFVKNRVRAASSD